VRHWCVISGGNSGNPVTHFYDNTPVCGCFFMSNLRHWNLPDFPLTQTPRKPLVLLTFNLRHWILAILAVTQIDC
jgi:hypothetical protein